SEETVPYSDSAPYCGTPIVYGVHWRHGLSIFGRASIFRSLVLPIRARLAHVLPWLGPTVQGGAQLLALDPPAVLVLWREQHRDAPWHHLPGERGTRGGAQQPL